MEENKKDSAKNKQKNSQLETKVQPGMVYDEYSTLDAVNKICLRKKEVFIFDCKLCYLFYLLISIGER